MKKILVLLLALVLCVCTLASCDFLNTIKGYIPGLGEETTTADNETPAAPTYDINAAVTYVYNLYKNKSITGADFDVTAVVAIKNAKYTVTWTVDTDKISISKKDDNTFTVNVDEEAPEELAYVLTATITAPDGQTGTKEFNLTVPKYVLWSHEQYMAAKENDTVVVKGIVVAINSKAAGNSRNHLFLADTKVVGGYYSYQMDQDPVADLGIEVGMTVEVTGPVTPYYGMQEIKGGTARIVDSNKQTVEVLDITDKVIAGESLANYVGLPVVMKNVEIAGQELGGTSDYLKFKIGEITSYVRTYVTDFPTTLKADDKATIDAAHADHFGWKANATGILVLYSGTPYLIPMGVDCFEYLELVVKTDAEKIADVLDQIKISTSFSSDEVVTLPTSVYSEVVLTWASNNDAIAIADGKMTVVVPEAAVEVTVTVTATCGETTAEKVFTVKLSRVATPVKEIIDLALSMDHNVYTEGKYLVAGIITEVYNTTYGNMKITDEFGNILTIYGTYSADGVNRYDAMESKPVAGDYVLILGIVGQYNGTPQVKNGWIMSFTTPTSVKDAIDTGAAQEHNTYTPDKYIVTGVITEVYNTTYGNMKITDADGNILTIYGTYSATGANRYDAIEGAPVAGDTVTIYGILGQYNGTPQVKNGWIVAVTKGSETPECTEHVDADGDAKCDNCGEELQVPPSIEDPAADSVLTVEQVIALGASKDHNTYTEGKYYVTGVITEVYNTQYGNMKITDEAGNILTIYGTYNADGTVRYDAMENAPVAGDTITVYGIVGQYNGTPQVKNGWITAHTPATPENPPVEDDELKLDLWMSNPDLFTVNGLNIKYNGAGNTYACVGANVADLAKGNNTFTVTVTNNGAADARVRFDLQCSVQVGNHKVCNVSAVGGDVWTDAEWGGSVVTVPAGQSVTLVITYDENTERGAVVDLVIFVDGARGDANVYNADVTLSGMAFSKVENETPETPETPDAPANEVFNITAVGGNLAEDGSQISWEANSFGIVSYKNDSTSAIRNSDADHFRCYAGTKFTLVGKTEAPIVKVVFTVTEAKYASVLVENATAAGYTATADGKVVTVVVNATSLEFVNNAQVRISKIEVVYTESDTPVVPDEPEVPENNDPAADSTLTIEQVLALGASKEHNVYTEGKYYVTGVITEVYNTTYGNMKIKDDKGNILTVYGTYSADGSTRYDAMAVQPVVGDTVTVYGIVGQYNGTPQVKNGWITAHTAGTGSTTPETPDTPDTPATPTPDAEGKITYTFANYEKGVQYAANEVHKLDDKVTVTTTDAHFTTEIRLYQQSANDYGPARAGTAVFELTSAVKSLSINAGGKKAPIEVYGSTNGTDWVLITTIDATTTYTDYEITLGSTEYTYIKLAAIKGQARVAAVTFGF